MRCLRVLRASVGSGGEAELVQPDFELLAAQRDHLRAVGAGQRIGDRHQRFGHLCGSGVRPAGQQPAVGL
ncbi:hypothetical protein D3C80_2191140 [compost metagenome]